ncbi:hypothetical protein BT96DRAFT_1007448 [Gymnopus androsaceus JB14]|uniref:Uncharacterized protein n=1 Tax=Gymnopus androsaceus JB14 TaxID=1447944 RepID=A0A6A4GI36_9AGAR|nr:hypothetical protein BT96DRAFT_1007448 [Gymnopus androsaceus JB14]
MSSSTVNDPSSTNTTAPETTIVLVPPTDPGWKNIRLNVFRVCSHSCPHAPPAPGHTEFIPNCYAWPRNTGTRTNDHHRRSRGHVYCRAPCPQFGKADRDITPVKATFEQSVRATILYSKNRGNPNFNKKERDWIKEVENGNVFGVEFMRLWNAAPSLPNLRPSYFTDGAIGSAISGSWNPNYMQYEDLPTHLNAHVRPFDEAAAKEGRPAMSGASVPGTASIVLGAHLLPTPAAQLPVSNIQVPDASLLLQPPAPDDDPKNSPSPSGDVTSAETYIPQAPPNALPAPTLASTSKEIAAGVANSSPASFDDNALGSGTGASETSPAPSMDISTALLARLGNNSLGSGTGASETSPAPSIVSSSDISAALPDQWASIDNNGLSSGMGASENSSAPSVVSLSDGSAALSDLWMASIGGKLPGWTEGRLGLYSRQGKKTIAPLERIAFIPYSFFSASQPITNVEQAEHQVSDSFYWVKMPFNMASPRRRDFVRLVQEAPGMNHFIWWDLSNGFRRATGYMWEWVVVALLFWERSTDVVFMSEKQLLDVLNKRQESPQWETIRQCQLVLGKLDGYPRSLKYYFYTTSQLRAVETLGSLGVKFWPHPLAVVFAARKRSILAALAPAIEKAGGFSERPITVQTLAHGLQLLNSDFVIKKEFSNESEHVYKSNSTDTCNRFRKDFAQDAGRSIFFALKFNRDLLELGEVRVFFTYGVVSYMVHSCPYPLENSDEHTRPITEWTGTSSYPCHGFLRPLGALASTSDLLSEFPLAWFDRNSPLDFTGTRELLAFLVPVYYHLIEQEHIVLSGLKTSPGVCSNRVLCRIDVGLVWDEEACKYRYTINEVQEGRCGLFQRDPGRMTVQSAFVAAIEHGALQG